MICSFWSKRSTTTLILKTVLCHVNKYNTVVFVIVEGQNVATDRFLVATCIETSTTWAGQLGRCSPADKKNSSRDLLSDK